METVVNPAADAREVVSRGPLCGELRIPGDKSISHRAIMLASLATGRSTVSNFLAGEDCLGTMRAFRAMGVPIHGEGTAYEVEGKGLAGLTDPSDVLDVGNSGTTIRLMLGVLAGSPVFAVLTGDASIRRRPMARVVEPLRRMGARIWGREDGRLAPLAVRGGQLAALAYESPVASAQVKSAVLLAGLAAEGVTSVTEPARSRDHTERMLRALGAEVEVDGLTVRLRGGQALRGTDLAVPGDISSAAFWLVAGSIVPGSRLVLRDVGVNPTRTGILDVLRRMGASIAEENPRTWGGEPVADLVVQAAPLCGTRVAGDEIPRLVDEIPILALAAACADGVTEVADAAELRVKESDRIAAIARGLGALGARIDERPDGLLVHGGTTWKPGPTASGGDHRMAMTFAVAGALSGPVAIAGTACTETSYPGFWESLESVRG